MKNYNSGVAVFAAMLFVMCFATWSVRAQDADWQEKARGEIIKSANAFVDAFQKGDAAALAAFWTEDGDYTDVDGRVLRGRKAIAEDFAELFHSSKGANLRIEVGSIRFLTGETAIEEGVTSVLAPDNSLPSRVHYSNVLLKKDGRWLLASVRETPYIPPNNHDQLRPLEWLIGEWVEDVKEDSAGGHIARVSFEWTPDQNFILALRAVGVKGVLLDNGHQRIGWDPAAKMIRTWTFESDGGFGEGSWKQEGDKWVGRTSSVLRSGSLMTTTTIVTRTDEDTITWQSTEQELDGKPISDSPVVRMKRVRE